MRKLSLILVIVFAIGLIAGCGGSDDKGGSAKVILSDPGWDSVKFHNSVVSFIAEHAYDMKTEVVAGSTPITHAALVKGDIDVNVEVWTDNLASYEDDIASGKIVELGINFDDNAQGIYVPRYVIEGDASRGIKPMAPDLKTVADLKKYATVFKDDENPSKGRLYGSIPGWAADEIMFKKFNHYKLDENFNYFRPGSDATLYASFTTAYDKGLPIAGYLWEPTWITGKLDLVLLQDAPYSEKDFKDGKTSFPPVKVAIAANKAFLEKAPEFVEFLKKYRTSSVYTAEALAYIADNKASYDDTAKYMLKQHPEMIDQWLAADKAKKVHDALAK